MSGRGLLEIVKTLGVIEVAPGVTLFYKDYYEKFGIAAQGQFVFLFSEEITTIHNLPVALETDDEDKAINMIDSALSVLKGTPEIAKIWLQE